MNCHTCGQALTSFRHDQVLRPGVALHEQPILCQPCLEIVRQISTAFGEAVAQICRLARQGGFQ